MTTEPTTDTARTPDSEAAIAAVARSSERDDGYSQRHALLSAFFLIMCAFRDTIFITGPILVFRMHNSLKSGGIYGSALLFGGMLSFL